MKLKTFFFIFLFLVSFSIDAQEQVVDSVQKKAFIKKNIVPASLITLGVLFNNSRFEKRLKTTLRNVVGNNYEFKIDNYAQFVPVVQIFSADILGVRAKNHWFDQGKYLFMANVLSSSLTFYFKKWIGKTRPNGSDNLSFPSGHTTFAFTNATVLYEEFKDTSPLLAYTGFGFATTTGVFRMINNKHWFSDVLMGAGIGMLSTYLVYHFKPLKNWNPFLKSKNITLLPNIIGKEKGIYLTYRF